MTDSAADAPNEAATGAARSATKPAKSAVGRKATTTGLVVVTAFVAFVGVATIVGALQQLALASCTRAGGFSCSVPAAGDVPWIELIVGVICLGILGLLLRKR